MRDGDDPLRPVPELGVRHDQRNDDREDDERAAHHVDNEGLLEVLLLVGGAHVVEAGEGRALVEGVVEQVRHPLLVGQAVVGGCVDGGRGELLGEKVGKGGVGGGERVQKMNALVQK